MGVPAPCHPSEARVQGAGLVQYKTTPNLQQVIDCSPSENQLKRVKRLKRNVFLAGQLHSLPRPGFRPEQAYIVTLTFDTLGTLGKGAHDWHAGQITRTIDRYRRWCERSGYECKTVRVAELQKRGTVHYHLVCWLPLGVGMPHWDKANGQRRAFWPHGMANTEKLRTNVGYLMKYLSKISPFHQFPKGLRLTGTTGLDQSARRLCAWHSLPRWLRTTYGVGEVTRKRMGYVVNETGELLPPMYRCVFNAGKLHLTQLRDLPDCWQTSQDERYFGPYCSWPRV